MNTFLKVSFIRILIILLNLVYFSFLVNFPIHLKIELLEKLATIE